MLETATAVLDWLGVIVFATTGALVASRKQMDVVGFALLGTVAGIGGGTLRDMLLGVLPVFWVKEPAYLVTCVLVSVVAFFTAHIPQSRYRILLWLDALGLALFAVTGAERAMAAGAGPVIAVAMGVITATFGGIVRDLLGGEIPVILEPGDLCIGGAARRRDLRAPRRRRCSQEAAIAGGFLAGFAVRAAALSRAWSLPRYRPRPGRKPEDGG